MEIAQNENMARFLEGLEEFEVNGFETSRIDEVGGIYYPNDSVDGTIAHARMNFLWTIPGWIINNAHLLNSVDALESVRFVSLPSIHHIKEKLIDYINDFSNGILSENGQSNVLLNDSSSPIEIVPQYQADSMFANSWAESSGISTTAEQQVAAYSAATGLATDQYPLAPALSPFPMLINEDGSLLGGDQVTSANTSQFNFYFMGYKDVTQEVTIDPITGLYN